MSIVAYLRALTQMGPKYTIVTDGARGAFVGSRDEIFFSPALETKIVGTAGAGDAFGATISAYLALGRRIDEAVCAATVNSASVVEHVDTQTGLLRRGELDQKVASAQRAMRRWPNC
jgi:ribokinase